MVLVTIHGRNDEIVQGHLGASPATAVGYVKVFLPSPRKILSVLVRLKGTQKTSYIHNSHSLESNMPSPPVHVLSGDKRTLINETHKLYCNGDLINNFEASAEGVLPAGEYTLPFRIRIPEILPPSFTSKDGVVEYKLKAFVNFSDSIFDAAQKNTVLPLLIRSGVPVMRTLTPPLVSSSLRPSRNSVKFDSQSLNTLFHEPTVLSNLAMKNIPEDALRYQITIPKRAYGPGDEITAFFHIASIPEDRLVTSVRVTVFSDIEYRSQAFTRSVLRKVACTKDRAKHQGEYWRKSISVKLPENLSSIDFSSPLINVRHFLQIEIFVAKSVVAALLSSRCTVLEFPLVLHPATREVSEWLSSMVLGPLPLERYDEAEDAASSAPSYSNLSRISARSLPRQ
ncbi:MAG: hypothetical protein SGCHY_005066 [Lobulomycetales sp.]